METTGYRYTVNCNVRLTLTEVERLEQFVLISSDCKIKADMIDLVRAWRTMFTVAGLSHERDEHEFSVSADELHFLANALPETEELRGNIIDAYNDVMAESQYRNHTEPWEREQPWYVQPLRQIADTIWWRCNVAVSPMDGLVTVYADGFPQMKCKFRPRMGRNENVFEVVANAWQRDEAAAWSDWRKGSVHTLQEFVAAMNQTRSIANGKLQTWDDENKCFTPTPQGENFVPIQQ